MNDAANLPNPVPVTTEFERQCIVRALEGALFLARRGRLAGLVMGTARLDGTYETEAYPYRGVEPLVRSVASHFGVVVQERA